VDKKSEPRVLDGRAWRQGVVWVFGGEDRSPVWPEQRKWRGHGEVSSNTWRGLRGRGGDPGVLLESRGNPLKGFKRERNSQNLILEGPFRPEVYAVPSVGSGLKKLAWVRTMAHSAGVTEKTGDLCSLRWKGPQKNTLNGKNQGAEQHQK